MSEKNPEQAKLGVLFAWSWLGGTASHKEKSPTDGPSATFLQTKFELRVAQEAGVDIPNDAEPEWPCGDLDSFAAAGAAPFGPVSLSGSSACLT